MSSRRRVRVIVLAVGVVAMATAQTHAAEPDDVVYDGELIDGVRAGRGSLTWSDGSRYEGEFQNGLRHGQGVLRLPTGDIYTGAFENDAMTGRGRLAWANGDVYEGDFVDGERTGRGAYVWRTGAHYTGDLVGGVPHGQGVYEYADGTTYRGRFEAGAKAGLGELLQDSTRYVGWFQDDERHGLGHYQWRDGTLYKGYFAFGRQNGPGIKRTPNGELAFEVWDANRLVAAANVIPVPRCALTIDDAPWMFDGDQCINGLAHGRGTAVRLDGSAYIVDGRFVLGRLVAGELSTLSLGDGIDLGNLAGAALPSPNDSVGR